MGRCDDKPRPNARPDDQLNALAFIVHPTNNPSDEGEGSLDGKKLACGRCADGHQLRQRGSARLSADAILLEPLEPGVWSDDQLHASRGPDSLHYERLDHANQM